MAIMFRNRIAACLWVFAALWLAVLLIMTYLLARDGLPAEYPPWAATGVAAFFWLGGIGLTRYALSKPCFFVTIGEGGQVLVTWRYPHKVVRKRFSASDIRAAVVVEDEDDEGNPYFFARVGTSDSKHFDIKEGHSRPLCQDACVRFNRALRDRLDGVPNRTSSAR